MSEKEREREGAEEKRKMENGKSEWRMQKPEEGTTQESCHRERAGKRRRPTTSDLEQNTKIS